MPFVLSVLGSLGCDFVIKEHLNIYLENQQQSLLVQMEQSQELETDTKLKLVTCKALEIANQNTLLLIHLRITKVICMFQRTNRNIRTTNNV